MDKTVQRVAIGLGVVAAGHYVFSPYFYSDGNGPGAPPPASISAATGATGPSLAVTNAVLVYDGTLGVKREVTPPSDVNRQGAIGVPGLPSTDLGAGYPGGIFTSPKKSV